MLWRVVVGVIIGAIAGWFVTLLSFPGSQQKGVANSVMGMVGAVFAGGVYIILDDSGGRALNIWSVLTACVGALLLLFLSRYFIFSK